MIRNGKHPRGIALLVVVAVLGLLSAISYAMLSAASLSNRTAGNQNKLMTADYLAESGLNLALYYLQYSDRAPAVNASGYWGGTGGELTLSSNIAGTVNVTVTRDPSDSWSYEVVSVGTAGTNTGGKISKTTGARVYVRNEYQIKHAVVFNGNATIPGNMTVQGDIWAYKNLGITKGPPAASVTGAVYTKTALTFPATTYLAPLGGWKSTLPNDYAPAPSGVSELNLYQTYTVDDVTYSADTTTATTFQTVTKNPTASNPAGVIYKNGNFDLDDDTVINGTLVVQGSVTVKGPNVVITPRANFPALIVTGNLIVEQSRNDLTVNGICYVGGVIRANGSTPGLLTDYSKLTIDGALLMGTTGAVNFTWSVLFNVTTNVKFNATKAKAPDLTPVQRVAKGVSIVRWGLP